ncbi:hypothetical protein [Streptomyces sp. NPDC004296]|uniref:hypothetical protein n=1 Tax=Streptomyces sp. NPDC004296 TaxID=3364697 RepID=UPI0036AB6CE2
MDPRMHPSWHPTFGPTDDGPAPVLQLGTQSSERPLRRLLIPQGVHPPLMAGPPPRSTAAMDAAAVDLQCRVLVSDRERLLEHLLRLAKYRRTDRRRPPRRTAQRSKRLPQRGAQLGLVVRPGWGGGAVQGAEEGGVALGVLVGRGGTGGRGGGGREFVRALAAGELVVDVGGGGAQVAGDCPGL